jgi:antitoxin (DNA-binding transcriptional repressor) of toxin-antitoxin stability system
MTISVGIRELKNRLSEHLRRVRSGDTILITDRGQVVAEINPPGQAKLDSSFPPGLIDLARRGLATLGGPNDPSAYPSLPPLLRKPGLAAQLLNEERGER